MGTLLLAFVAFVLVGPISSAHAICAAIDDPDPFAEVESARVAFIGTAVEGDEYDGELVSPAAFTVEHRLDRAKRTREKVATVVSRSPNGSVGIVSDGASIKAGERWLIVGSRDKGKVWPDTCGVATGKVDGAAAPALTFKGAAAIVSPRWANARGLRLVKADGAVPSLPTKARALRAPGITAARLMHHGKATKLKRSGGWWRYPGAEFGDRVVVATENGFWTAELRGDASYDAS